MYLLCNEHSKALRKTALKVVQVVIRRRGQRDRSRTQSRVQKVPQLTFFTHLVVGGITFFTSLLGIHAELSCIYRHRQKPMINVSSGRGHPMVSP